MRPRTSQCKRRASLRAHAAAAAAAAMARVLQGRVYAQDGVPHMNAQQFHRLVQDAGFVEPEGACARACGRVRACMCACCEGMNAYSRGAGWAAAAGGACGLGLERAAAHLPPLRPNALLCWCARAFMRSCAHAGARRPSAHHRHRCDLLPLPAPGLQAAGLQGGEGPGSTLPARAQQRCAAATRYCLGAVAPGGCALPAAVRMLWGACSAGRARAPQRVCMPAHRAEARCACCVRARSLWRPWAPLPTRLACSLRT